MKLVADAWHDFETKVIPLGAPEGQRDECRRAFYAGAQSLLYGLVGMMDPGQEPTDADITKMDDIKAELDKFGKDVQEGRA